MTAGGEARRAALDAGATPDQVDALHARALARADQVLAEHAAAARHAEDLARLRALFGPTR